MIIVKKTLMYKFILLTFSPTPMQIPCKSHFPPNLRNGPETDLQRTYNGLTVMV